MSRALDWNREGRIWPHREASAFVPSGGATWHVQRMGPAGAPQVLLLHGTGASVHSWRDVMPLLARDHDCIAIDLPRHAYTRGHSVEHTALPRMAGKVAGLVADLGLDPAIIVGHSAGTALAIQLALDHGFSGPILGLNSALRPFPGPAAQVFPALAKALFVNPLVPRIFSATTMLPGEADRFLRRSTGSRIDATGLACYSALLRNPGHAKGALAMMANWDLPRLRARLGETRNPVLLVHSDRDAAIPLDWTREASGWLPNASLEVMEGFGHLAHEEAPDRAAALIRDFAARHGAACS
ncbi:alpha/beta fold hydrolase BchO [Erythrobacter sp. HL-111]|uniref:alpha/beta fold hydrolase BchO n=1 Tax=Erythrobacter sp. HL-111 TaxID=1798193 RepID=UPI0006DB9B30|nr:alpha/beta fold hydrolase BchO [Erythrobacter sp. HL-111]KPP93914.1 MAG: magnesium chelatase accessory protein BchO [Erythrobacteraceae bacterium HL-111]SDS33783.1 magnesium chelatase accessory protein [Erythrobacter sp. HL-111]